MSTNAYTFVISKEGRHTPFGTVLFETLGPNEMRHPALRITSEPEDLTAATTFTYALGFQVGLWKARSLGATPEEYRRMVEVAASQAGWKVTASFEVSKADSLNQSLDYWGWRADRAERNRESIKPVEAAAPTAPAAKASRRAHLPGHFLG